MKAVCLLACERRLYVAGQYAHRIIYREKRKRKHKAGAEKE